jgi:hypothetical protein
MLAGKLMRAPSIGVSTPRLDPLGLPPRLSRLTDGQLGQVARPRLSRAVIGQATVHDRHILDMVGFVLATREQISRHLAA